MSSFSTRAITSGVEVRYVLVLRNDVEELSPHAQYWEGAETSCGLLAEQDLRN